MSKIFACLFPGDGVGKKSCSGANWPSTAGHNFHALVLVLVGACVVARRASGKLQPNAPASLRSAVALWQYVVVQGLDGVGVAYLMPLLRAIRPVVACSADALAC